MSSVKKKLFSRFLANVPKPKPPTSAAANGAAGGATVPMRSLAELVVYLGSATRADPSGGLRAQLSALWGFAAMPGPDSCPPCTRHRTSCLLALTFGQCARTGAGPRCGQSHPRRPYHGTTQCLMRCFSILDPTYTRSYMHYIILAPNQPDPACTRPCVHQILRLILNQIAPRYPAPDAPYWNDRPAPIARTGDWRHRAATDGCRASPDQPLCPRMRAPPLPRPFLLVRFPQPTSHMMSQYPTHRTPACQAVHAAGMSAARRLRDTPSSRQSVHQRSGDTTSRRRPADGRLPLRSHSSAAAHHPPQVACRPRRPRLVPLPLSIPAPAPRIPARNMLLVLGCHACHTCILLIAHPVSFTIHPGPVSSPPDGP